MLQRIALITVALLVLLTGLAPLALAFSLASSRTIDTPNYFQGGGSDKPNIVLLLLDDHADTGNFLDLQRLPNISSIFLNQGISFTNYVATFSLCCPGRSALYSGLRPDHSGVTSNNGARLFDPRESIFTELQSVGYWTAGWGKWFNRTNSAAINRIQGMNAFAWKNAGQYFNYPVWIKDPTTGAISYAHYGNSNSDYSTDVISQYSMQSLNAVPAGQPVFLDMAPNATHGGPNQQGVKDLTQPVPDPKYVGDPRCQGIPPYDPESYNNVTSGKPSYVKPNPILRTSEYASGWPMEKNCEALLPVDDWFGQVLNWLTATGRINNTIFILTSDNGMGWGNFGIPGKVAPYTVRMPLFITWPGVTPVVPTQDATLLNNTDIAETLCELAGCEMGPYFNYSGPPDGESFAGLIAPGYSAPVVNRQSVVIEGQTGNVPKFQGLVTSANNPLGQWMYVNYVGLKSGIRTELYDLSGGPCINWQVGDPGDPCTLTNVAKQNPILVNSLQQELNQEWAYGSY